MGGKKDATVSSAESVQSSDEESAAEYVVEKVVAKRIVKGKVSAINRNNYCYQNFH